jgi:NADH-quinone oxidoreductase subunit J
MNITFYISALVAILGTLLAITRRQTTHGLLYVFVSLLAVATAFLVLGAPFAAALEVITYAGAIMVMFLFAVMILDPGTREAVGDHPAVNPRLWLGPVLLTLILLGEFIYILAAGGGPGASGVALLPHQVGLVLFGPYVLGVELASMLLLAGLVAGYHLGRPTPRKPD